MCVEYHTNRLHRSKRSKNQKCRSGTRRELLFGFLTPRPATSSHAVGVLRESRSRVEERRWKQRCFELSARKIARPQRLMPTSSNRRYAAVFTRLSQKSRSLIDRTHHRLPTSRLPPRGRCSTGFRLKTLLGLQQP